MNRSVAALIVLVALGAILWWAVTGDDALADNGGGRSPTDFPELAVDVFAEMDRPKADQPLPLSADEIKGRNTWNLWCGGNEQFWDRMTRDSYGLVDLLRTLDSRRRPSRFKDIGLINQPGYQRASQPDQYGLWLDQPIAGQAEPAGIDPAVYGRASGVLGFRLFDNPEFSAAKKAYWEQKKGSYYDDDTVAADPELVRPYRVGVSCGACHIAFNPVNPPTDPEAPAWANLASAIGNQYLSEGRAFAGMVARTGFLNQMIATQPRGTSDTSRIATDHINNPNMINPIFALGARLQLAHAHEEELAGESMLLPGAQSKMGVPRILKDGADSVGVGGATLRVYVNIGMYSQHWLKQHNALIGLRGQEPFSIKAANANSVYWNATAQKLDNIVRFFQKLQPFKLADAPGGAAYQTQDPAVLARGRTVFAENCASCHSSKRPPNGLDQAEEQAWFRAEVAKPEFFVDNLFSDERPHSVAAIGTNASRAAATNATKGHIWANFSSATYKQRESVGTISVFNPYTNAQEPFTLPAGGPGYYRTPSLVALWSSAPFLHNNALGLYNGDPSVAGRMAAFTDACEKLLWPGKRAGRDSIWRTQEDCELTLNSASIPTILRKALELAGQIDNDGYLRIGRVPKGTPINMLANIDPEADVKDLVALCIAIKTTLAGIKLDGLTGDAAQERLRAQLGPKLWKVNKCPDLIEDRGHEYGKDLSDDDKRALIQVLATL
ncbi:MAG: hypothetical protein IPK26_09110 [Planctomycetes bacterium]|nr:hypothetical protein [Planctomycetota bacterium]